MRRRAGRGGLNFLSFEDVRHGDVDLRLLLARGDRDREHAEQQRTGNFFALVPRIAGDCTVIRAGEQCVSLQSVTL